MDHWTLLLLIFVIILYSYLFLVRKEIILFSKTKSLSNRFYPFPLIFLVIIYYSNHVTLDNIFQGIALVLIVLSYLFNVKGLASQHIVLYPYRNKGIKFKEINHVIIIQDLQKKELRVNFFKCGLRLPMVKFEQPLDEFVHFLSSVLLSETTIDIVVTD